MSTVLTREEAAWLIGFFREMPFDIDEMTDGSGIDGRQILDKLDLIAKGK